ncbi:MAG: DUF2764 family protein [Candidatus Omnitrophota bacterium]
MYYYFASTLPMINWGDPLPFPVEEFADNCRRLLSPHDASDAMIALGLGKGEVSNGLLKRWQRFERALKNEIAAFRAVQRQQNALTVVHGERDYDMDIAEGFGRAVKAGQPLEAQRILLKIQWDRLDEWSLNKDFSIEFILTYAIKLKIMARLHAFRDEEGGKRLEEIMMKTEKNDL